MGELDGVEKQNGIRNPSYGLFIPQYVRALEEYPFLPTPASSNPAGCVYRSHYPPPSQKVIVTQYLSSLRLYSSPLLTIITTNSGDLVQGSKSYSKRRVSLVRNATF